MLLFLIFTTQTRSEEAVSAKANTLNTRKVHQVACMFSVTFISCSYSSKYDTFLNSKTFFPPVLEMNQLRKRQLVWFFFVLLALHGPSTWSHETKRTPCLFVWSEINRGRSPQTKKGAWHLIGMLKGFEQSRRQSPGTTLTR